ncbi:SPW repeat protein [Nocardia sp. CNY236]|uniref:SPW repeat domain-containing protein n=1 Tax=Nocardia sp. CNY236 TaxID=1169152 RepID=UPI000423CDD4|nr:SPW repeat protein [Nocardia sp. CNY236]
MFTESRAQDFLAVVLGIFAALSPIWVETTANARWSLIVLGVVIALTGLAQMVRPSMASADYVMGLSGVLLFISPWVMDFTDYRGASWTAWVVGVVTAVVAIAALPMVSGRLHGTAAHQ